jgi:thiamine pyrophosphate-dependent enzyme
MHGVTTTDASGARIIAELIHAHAVSYVFFVPAILRDGLAELGSLGVRSVSAHGEKAAAYLADGYALTLLGSPSTWLVVCSARPTRHSNRRPRWRPKISHMSWSWSRV